LPQRPHGARALTNEDSVPVAAHLRGRAIIDDFEYPELDDDPNLKG
jgi:hypothetical protein